jgi:hypothetical protein
MRSGPGFGRGFYKRGVTVVVCEKSLLGILPVEEFTNSERLDT